MLVACWLAAAMILFGSILGSEGSATATYIRNVATLSTTLSSASSNRAPSGASSYPVPRVQNPYLKMGAQTSFGSGGSGQQGLYAGLLQSQQFQRPQVSTEFQTQYNFDPVLAKLSALGEMSIANARTEAANAKKQALIDAGSEEIAKGVGADENTLSAAKQNPFSTQALLMKDFQDRQRQMDESLNQSNLFYSGERVRQMGELERGRAQAETGFGSNLRGLLAAIDEQMRAAEEEELSRQIAAQIAAAGRGPTGPIGGGGSGGGGATGPLWDSPPGTGPLSDPANGTFAGYTPSQPVGMESPGAMYIPSLGFRAPVYEDPDPLAALLQGRYTNPVAY
jgi:hypothetical protein